MAEEMTVEYVHQHEKAKTGCGEDLSACRSFEDVLRVTGTDWNVSKEPVFLADGSEIPNSYAIVRDIDGKVLSKQTVSKQFVPFQNREFMDLGQGLIDMGIRPNRGGAYFGGAKTWYSFDMGDTDILGDPHHQYIILSNAHDGSGSVTVAVALVRIVCSNQMSFALHSAPFKWAFIHKTGVNDKISEAADAVLRGREYVAQYIQEMQTMQSEKVGRSDIMDFLDAVVPYPKQVNDVIKKNIDEKREQILHIYDFKPDLSLLGDTKYHLLSAVSDFVSHPKERKTPKAQAAALERANDRLMTGDPMLQRAYRLLAAV